MALNDIEQENTYYYHGEHPGKHGRAGSLLPTRLGSANVVTDSYGELYEHMEYTPYGEMWVEDTAESLDFIPFRFTGKEWDEETGLYYMSARYQNPVTSRWMSVDPIAGSLIDPNRENFSIIESINSYSYVSNNPVNYFDPTGNSEIESYKVHGDEFQDNYGTLRSSEYLNERLAEVSHGYLGGIYLLGGENPSTEGGEGIDCSSGPLLAAEKITGVNIRDRTAKQIVNDPKLVVEGREQTGSMNGFDWKTENNPNGDGHIDHLTINANNGTEVHPSSVSKVIKSIQQGSIDGLSGNNTNVTFNWKYILTE